MSTERILRAPGASSPCLRPKAGMQGSVATTARLALCSGRMRDRARHGSRPHPCCRRGAAGRPLCPTRRGMLARAEERGVVDVGMPAPRCRLSPACAGGFPTECGRAAPSPSLLAAQCRRRAVPCRDDQKESVSAATRVTRERSGCAPLASQSASERRPEAANVGRQGAREPVTRAAVLTKSPKVESKRDLGGAVSYGTS